MQKQYKDAEVAFEEGQALSTNSKRHHSCVKMHGDIEPNKMIIGCLTKHIEVYQDYKLYIDFSINFDQFSPHMDFSDIVVKTKARF